MKETKALFRFGYALSGRCRPKMSLTCTSSQLDWSQISQQWYYEDLAFGGLRSPQKIPTLAEFLEHFVDDPRLKVSFRFDILVHFWKYFWSIFDPFGPIFDPFGPILDPI